MKIMPKTSVIFDVAAHYFILTAGSTPVRNGAKHRGLTLNLVPLEAEDSTDSEPPK